MGKISVVINVQGSFGFSLGGKRAFCGEGEVRMFFSTMIQAIFHVLNVTIQYILIWLVLQH